MPQITEEALQDLRSGEVRILIATGKKGDPAGSEVWGGKDPHCDR